MSIPTCCLTCTHFRGHLARCATAATRYACDRPRDKKICEACEPCSDWTDKAGSKKHDLKDK